MQDNIADSVLNDRPENLEKETNCTTSIQNPAESNGIRPLSATTVKEMFEDCRPREKAVAKGIESLTTAELFALILGSGIKGVNVIDMCQDMLNKNNNNLVTLSRLTLKDIMGYKGVGKAKALQILAVTEIARRYGEAQLPQQPQIKCSADIYRHMRYKIAFLDHEEIWVMLLNRSHKITHSVKVSEGTDSASLFDIKKVMKQAITERAAAMILSHNHPSGNLRPSIPDDNITNKCRKACEFFDIALLDHIIITPDGYFSYKDEGKL